MVIKTIFIFLLNFVLYATENTDVIGNIKYYTIKKDETLISIARRFNLSFPEIMSANSSINDPWLLEEGVTIILPTRHILPSNKREGVVINKGDLRVYYYKNEQIHSYPIGIGRQDWETPIGKAIILNKKKNPYWTVPESIMKEEPHWPKVVKPGPDNPLGSRAIYLSMPGYLLHGTNKPWGVGMKVSHGCIRLYPESIEEMYELIKLGDKVTITDEPVKAGWLGGVLYLEVHVMHEYGEEEGTKKSSYIKLLPDALKALQQKAGIHIAKIDRDKVTEIVKRASGMPEAIFTLYDN